MESDSTERILKWLADTLESGGDFVVDQAPEVVRELVMWNLVANITLAGGLFTVCVVLAYVAWRILIYSGDFWAAGESFFVCAASSLVSLVFGVIALCVALKWWLAPKLCVLEWARGMLP